MGRYRIQRRDHKTTDTNHTKTLQQTTETSKHCNFAETGENMNGYYQFLKGFYGPYDIPINFEEKIEIELWDIKHPYGYGSTTSLSSPGQQRRNTPENYIRY